MNPFQNASIILKFFKKIAGSVKGRKAAKHAVSDWMEIEKERGISVTSSVLQFNYDGFCSVNYVFPASGWEIIAKVRLFSISCLCESLIKSSILSWICYPSADFQSVYNK